MATKNQTLKSNLLNGVRPHKCEKCQNSVWLESKIPLELHHIDGNTKNNNYDNLSLLCPNCHALTPNYRGKNMKRNRNAPIPEENFITIIPKCQSIKEVLETLGLKGKGGNYVRVREIIERHSLSLCKRSLSEKEIDSKIKQRKVIRPSADELRKMVWEKPTLKIAKELGVSFNAIVKWCNFYQIKRPSNGYWQKLSAGKLVLPAVVATAL